jgi:hypothetical protein
MARLSFPKSLPEWQRMFPNDAACTSYLETSRWADGFVCPTDDWSAYDKLSERGYQHLQVPRFLA